MKIVVVGAGIVGLGCAYELVRDGHEITVVDADTAGAGASHGSAAKITMAEPPRSRRRGWCCRD